MTHNHHTNAGGLLGLLAIGAAIGYAFGERAAKIFVTVLLVVGGMTALAVLGFWAYVFYRVVMGTI